MTERKEIELDKLEAVQDKLAKVKWGDKDVDNCLLFEYLGSFFQTDGDIMPDVRDKCTRAKVRAGSFRHIWSSSLSQGLKLRLYVSACCSILVYGSEGWILDEKTCRCLNGANAYMLSHLTGKTKHEEATAATTTFDIVAWIRARRLRWVGHIMRMGKNCNGEERQVKETLKVIFNNRQQGDILMDVAEDSWEALQKAAADRDKWRERVLALKKAARLTTRKPQEKKADTTTTHPVRQRFTFTTSATANTAAITRTRTTQAMVNAFFDPTLP